MIQPNNARRARPNMPNYGVTPDAVDDMLSWDWVDEKMHKARNFWICSVCADGRPHCVPVWGAWVGGVLYFGTDKNSVKARNIARDNRIVLHSRTAATRPLSLRAAVVEARRMPESLLKEGYRTLYREIRPRSPIGRNRRLAVALDSEEGDGLARARLSRYRDLLALRRLSFELNQPPLAVDAPVGIDAVQFFRRLR